MKRFLTLLFALLLAGTTCLMSCGGGDACTSHVDANADGKCDNCAADMEEETTEAPACTHRDANDDGKCDTCAKAFDDGIEQAPSATVECTVSVVSDRGEALSGIAFTLKSAKNEYALTSGADGTVKVTLAVGAYEVICAEGALPEGFLLLSNSVEITADTTTATVSVMDNNPDGSKEKPFFISEDTTAISIGAGEELFYIYRGASIRHLRIENAGIAVVYQDKTTNAENGVVEVTITPEMGAMQTFSVKNTTGAAIETEMMLVVPLGSMENPIAVTGASVNVTVPAGTAVYYAWTADKDGVLVVGSQNEKNNIALTNTATYAVSELTMGAAGAYIAVSAGDVVHISVGSTDEDNEVTVDVSLNCYLGTVGEPIPVITENVDLSLAKSATMTFSATAGKTVTIADESVSVGANGQTYAPVNGVVTFALGEDGIFTVTNTQDGINGVTVEVK